MFAQAYHELKNRQQKEIDNFPIAYAFNSKQLDDALEKLGADISEVCTYMGIGDVVRKADVPILKELLIRHRDETYNFLKGNEQDAYEAIRYEMDNHEYAINWSGDEDVLGCFCLTEDLLKEFGLVDIYNRARRDHMADALNWS